MRVLVIVGDVAPPTTLLSKCYHFSDITLYSESKESNPRVGTEGRWLAKAVRQKQPWAEDSMTTDKIIRVVTRASDGSLRTKDFTNFDEISGLHDQIGIDDCSTDLSLRGLPLFKGLVGPLPESSTVVRYESPDVFETLTKEWSQKKVKRRRRRKTTKEPGSVPAPNMAIDPAAISTPTAPSTPTSI